MDKVKSIWQHVLINKPLPSKDQMFLALGTSHKGYTVGTYWLDMELEAIKCGTSVISLEVQVHNLNAVQECENDVTLCKKVTMHQLTTMLATSKNVLFPGYNHLLTTGADDPSLADDWVIIKVSGHQHQWLAGGYDLEIEHV